MEEDLRKCLDGNEKASIEAKSGRGSSEAGDVKSESQALLLSPLYALGAETDNIGSSEGFGPPLVDVAPAKDWSLASLKPEVSLVVVWQFMYFSLVKLLTIHAYDVFVGSRKYPSQHGCAAFDPISEALGRLCRDTRVHQGAPCFCCIPREHGCGHGSGAAHVCIQVSEQAARLRARDQQ